MLIPVRPTFRYGRFAILLVLLAFASRLSAQERSFVLDPDKTTVTFTLGASLHTVHGSFKAKSGNLHFDPVSGAASGMIVIDATSGNSGDDGRDHKMHKEILESEKFPEISFSATHIVGTISNGSTVQLQGVFHIHGADHPLTLSVPLEMTANDLMAKLHFVIPYVEWGMKNPSTFILRVEKKVEIDIAATGHLIQK